MFFGQASKIAGKLPVTYFESSDINSFDSSLISAYLMETTDCLDSHGAFTATSTSQITTSTGKENNSLVPSSTSPAAEFASGAFVDTTGDYALSFWLKTDGVAGSGYLFSHYDDANNQSPIGVVVIPSTDTIHFDLETSSGAGARISSVALTDSTWHHCVETVQGTTHQAWLNGSSLGTQTISGTRRTGDMPRLFCRNFGTGNNSFSQGVDLDELYIWEGLSFGGGNPTEAAFVAALYNSGTGEFYA